VLEKDENEHENERGRHKSGESVLEKGKNEHRKHKSGEFVLKKGRKRARKAQIERKCARKGSRRARERYNSKKQNINQPKICPSSKTKHS